MSDQAAATGASDSKPAESSVKSLLKTLGSITTIAALVGWVTGIHDCPAGLAFARDPNDTLAARYSRPPPIQPVAEARTRDFAIELAPVPAGGPDDRLPSPNSVPELADGCDPVPSPNAESRLEAGGREISEEAEPAAGSPIKAADEWSPYPLGASVLTAPPASPSAGPPPTPAVPQPAVPGRGYEDRQRREADDIVLTAKRCWTTAYVPQNGCPVDDRITGRVLR